MFLLILLVAIAFCAIVLYLPYLAGLTTIEKKEYKPKQKKQKSRIDTGYVPPDEEVNLQQERHGLRSTLKEKVHVTSVDMPIRIKLNQDGALRRRGEKPVGDVDPNNYDYDLDELIREETEGEAARKEKEFYAKENVGGDKEAMV